MTLRKKKTLGWLSSFLGPLSGWEIEEEQEANTTEQDAGGQGHHTTPGQTDTRKDDMQMHTRRHPLTHTHTRHDATYHVNCRAKAKKTSPSSSSSLVFTSPALKPATLPLFFKRKSVATNQNCRAKGKKNVVCEAILNQNRLFLSTDSSYPRLIFLAFRCLCPCQQK